MRRRRKELGKFFQAAGEPERSAGYSGGKNELEAIVDQTSLRFPRDRAAKATTTTKRKLKPTNAAMMGCISIMFSFEDCDRAAPLGKSITAEAPGVI